MRRVIFGINITADGFCSHTDGIADDDLHAFHADLLRGSGILLTGRVTWELMVPYWPEVARTQSETPVVNDFARVYDAVEKLVFSRTLKRVEGSNTRLARATPAEEVLALREQPGRNITVGSLSIASQLSAAGLIDEYHFVVHPFVAGKGPRLFDTVTPQDRVALELVGTKTFASGVVALHYRKRG